MISGEFCKNKIQGRKMDEKEDRLRKNYRRSFFLEIKEINQLKIRK